MKASTSPQKKSLKTKSVVKVSNPKKPRVKTGYQLQKHREMLKLNTKDAFTRDLDRKADTLCGLIQKAGHGSFTKKKPKCRRLARLITYMIFRAQDQKPYFHIDYEKTDSGLPLCWNVPSKWNLNYIYYEWGHINSRHSLGAEAETIANLCLQSQRCNQHIQSGLNVKDLKAYGGALKEVIEKHERAFKELHNSERWLRIMKQVEKYKTKNPRKKVTSGSKVAAAVS